jgi:HEPN domain-containing protein
MKDKSDLVKGLIRKAESDLVNAEMCLSTKQSLDTVCFHAQQGAEKYIKAYLTAREADYPYIHNLEKLVELCVQYDPSFITIKNVGQELTPYAVELRYDDEFWPSLKTARQALKGALDIKEFVVDRLPKGVRPQKTKARSRV